MRPLLIRLAVAGCVLTSAAPAAAQNPAPAPAPAIQDTLRDALALYQRDALDEARAKFDAALAAAVRAGDKAAEAEAHRGIGLVLMAHASYPAARTEMDRALVLFQEGGDRLGVTRVRGHLGRLASLAGDRRQSEELYLQALAGYEALGDVSGQVHTLLALDFNRAGSPDSSYLDRAEALATTLGDLSLLGQIAHNRSDGFFARGDFASAIAKLETAISLFEQAGNRSALARALISLGRLNRAHGHADRSIDLYKRALAIQEAIGDRQGVIQTINATAVAFYALKRYREAISLYERALALARQTGSDLIVWFQAGNLASAYISAGQLARGTALLEQVIRQPLDDNVAAGRYTQLSFAYLRLGRYAESIGAADKALAAYAKIDNRGAGHAALINRARARQKLGLTADALADTREVLQRLEYMRTRLVPSDFMKQGFGETVQDTFGLAVSLFHDLQRDDLALETAARAQGRAFLDLLASRGPGATPAARPGTPSPALTATLPPNALDLASPESAPAPSVDDIRATARRLRSTLLAYFVTADATYVWLVPPEGAITAARVKVSAARLKDLVRQTRPGAAPSTRPQPAAAAASVVAAQTTTPAPPALRTRGGDVFFAGVQPSTAWRTLYGLLIRPIQPQLPRAPGSRLTILPHGPLSQLSFAALDEGQGRYLIERYTIHYAPAAGALRFTGETRRRLTDAPPRYLLVADPSAMPAGGRSPLRALPASRREVGTIASLLPRDAVSVLTGGRARESEVRAQLADATVIHFATHGIVRDDAPFESFLALGRDGSGAGADGRLTEAEIYDLDLHADLVMLSACRTALGAVSGDGVLGLTRAFFYAGAPSIVATMWDVPDEPTDRLVPEFYRLRLEGREKAEALRAAQLRLLRDLRAGRVKVGKGDGAVALPENPFFWAGFVLVGEA